MLLEAVSINGLIQTIKRKKKISMDKKGFHCFCIKYSENVTSDTDV